MIKIPCINCKIPLKFLFSLKLRGKVINYLRCERCLMVQIFPLSNNKNLYQTTDPFSHFISTNPQARFINNLPFGKRLIQKYLQLTDTRQKEILKLKNSGNILDIGCSGGKFLASFKKGWRKFGLEINSSMVKRLKKTLPEAKIYRNSIEQQSLPVNFFDIISLWHVLEHINNPRIVFKKIHSSLNTQGILVIEVPNGESLWFKIFRQSWQMLIPPQHLYFYTQKSLTELLQKNGFKIIKVKNFGITSPSAVSSLANFLRSRTINSTLAITISLIFFPIAMLVNLFSFRLRENLMIVAKKLPNTSYAKAFKKS